MKKNKKSNTNEVYAKSIIKKNLNTVNSFTKILFYNFFLFLQ